MTLFDLRVVEPSRPALIDESGLTLTYGDLVSLCEEVASMVEPRRVAVVFARNTIGCAAVSLALLQGGVVPLLLDEAGGGTIARRFLEIYEPEYVVRPLDLPTELSDFEPLARVYGDELLVRRNSTSALTHPDLALLLTTSGSTGSPKVVRLSYENLRCNGEAIALALGIRRSDRPVTSLPLHYSYGFSVLNSHLRRGSTILLTNASVIEKKFWQFFVNEEATSLAGVPFTYQMLQRVRFKRMTLPSLRSMTQAGGRMSTTLIREFSEFARSRGVDFIVMYGQTEATARMSTVPPDRSLEKLGSIGVPIPGGEFFLRDSDGGPVKTLGDVGELCFRGPNVALGYAKSRVDLVKGDEWGGVLRTGDLAKRDADDFYYVTGRLSRFAKVFGKRLSLDDIEEMCLDQVAHAACVSGEDKVVVWVTDAELAPKLRLLLGERTNLHPSAFDVRSIDVIPRTASGKVNYASLERLAEK